MSNVQNKATAAAHKRAEQAEQPERSTKSHTTSDDFRVSSTWTGLVHITDRELEAIELYLGDALDQLLSLVRRPRARGPPE